MPQGMKQNFYNFIRQVTLNFDVFITYSLNADYLQTISLESVIFFDGLNKDSFLRTEREIGGALWTIAHSVETLV